MLNEEACSQISDYFINYSWGKIFFFNILSLFYFNELNTPQFNNQKKNPKARVVL